jgi:hypothetical protein
MGCQCEAKLEGWALCSMDPKRSSRKRSNARPPILSYITRQVPFAFFCINKSIHPRINSNI